MQPLRQIETLPSGDFSRSDEKKLAPPQHWAIPSLEATIAYVDFLYGLSDQDRELVLRDMLHYGDVGEVALARGYPDVTETRIGICGHDEPIVIYRSETANSELQTSKDKWHELAKSRGVAKGDQIASWMDDYRQIEFGFQRLVAEIIYGDYGKDWLTEHPVPHMEELLTDEPQLRQLLSEWYAENNHRALPLRMPFIRRLFKVS